MLFKSILFASVTALPLAACYAEAPAPAYAATTAPALTSVAPGVEVVTDWGAPVFFADDFYWYLDGGLWYRSAYLGGPRIRVDVVPPVIARIPHPEVYAHYAPPRMAFARPAPRRWGGGRRL